MMGHKHDYTCTDDVIRCRGCGKTFQTGDHKSSGGRNAGLVFAGIIILLGAMSVIGTVLLDSDDYLDVEASALFYYGIISGITKETPEYDITNMDVNKFYTYVDEKSSQTNEEIRKVEAERIVQEKAEFLELENEYELLIHAYTNDERTKRGLEPLRLDEKISEVAKLHSANMLAQEFVEHTDPAGRGPDERGELLGVTCVKQYDGHTREGLGENVIYFGGYSSEDVHGNSKLLIKDWMESEGHRENILDPGYDRIGVGFKISDSEIYGTQNFC